MARSYLCKWEEKRPPIAIASTTLCFRWLNFSFNCPGVKIGGEDICRFFQKLGEKQQQFLSKQQQEQQEQLHQQRRRRRQEAEKQWKTPTPDYRRQQRCRRWWRRRRRRRWRSLVRTTASCSAPCKSTLRSRNVVWFLILLACSTVRLLCAELCPNKSSWSWIVNKAVIHLVALQVRL